MACGLSAAATPSICQQPPSRVAPPELPSSDTPTLPLSSSPALASLQHLFKNEGDGWFAGMGGLGDGNGIALGGGYRLATTEGTLTTRALVSTRESFLLSADWTRALDTRGHWSLSLGIVERRDAQQLFSGTGSTPDAIPTGYALNTTTADVRAGWRPRSWLTATIGVAAVRPTITRSSDDDIAALAARYSPGEAAGLAKQPTFAVFHGGLQVQTRRHPHQQSGGRYSVEWRHYDDREDAGYAFDLLRVELQQDFALGSPNRTLLLDLVGQQATPSSGSSVPFYFQPTLGGGRSLRGYDRQRFRDLSALYVQAEYQQRVHKYVAAAVFFDAGQVAPRLFDMRMGTLLTSYGVGVRLGRATGPALRTDIAFGGESRARLVVGFSTGF